MSGVRVFAQPELRKPTLVLALEGWNDAGEAATTAIRYIAKQNSGERFAELDGEDYYDFTVRRPQVAVDEGVVHEISWPTNEFFHAPADAESDVVLGVGVEPHLRWRTFSDEIIGLVDDLGIHKVALLGAFLADVLYSRPVEVSGVASSPAVLAKLAIEPTTYHGPTGMVGVLGYRLRERGCEVASLWAGLPHYVNVSPNPRGSLALIEKVSDFVGLRVDLEPLRGAAAECEERVSAMVAADPELSEYVRQLKRREFAQ
jgi:predicted ATP-grasp superfamily ATP-dependent carboligase